MGTGVGKKQDKIISLKKDKMNHLKDIKKMITLAKSRMGIGTLQRFNEVTTLKDAGVATSILAALGALLGNQHVYIGCVKEVLGRRHKEMSHLICEVLEETQKKMMKFVKTISINELEQVVKQVMKKLCDIKKWDKVEDAIYLDDALIDVLHVLGGKEVNIKVTKESCLGKDQDIQDVEDIGSTMSKRAYMEIFNVVGSFEKRRVDDGYVKLGDLTIDFQKCLNLEQMLSMEIDGIIFGIATRAQGMDMMTLKVFAPHSILLVTIIPFSSPFVCS